MANGVYLKEIINKKVKELEKEILLYTNDDLIFSDVLMMKKLHLQQQLDYLKYILSEIGD